MTNNEYTLKITIVCHTHFSSNSTKTTLFTYNEKLQGVLSRHRNSTSDEAKPTKLCDNKLKSHESEVTEPHHTRSLDFRLSEAEEKAKAEKTDTDSTKKDNIHDSSKRLSFSKDTQVIL